MIYVLLGLLCLRSLTQYDMLKAMKTPVSPFYQPSLGSIQATLKKMLDFGWISGVSADTGRKKTVYSLTDEGREAFEGWMLSGDEGMHLNRFDAELSTRLFFLGVMKPEQRLRIVGAAVRFAEKTLHEYTQADEAYQEMKYPEEFRDIAVFQLKTLALGIHQLASTLGWLKKLYKELEEIK
jgi:DNA-binding PadR family transcriptional regulator